MTISATAVLLAACAANLPGQSAKVPELRPGVPAGYLAPEARPDSLALLPQPPTAESAAFALDKDTAKLAQTQWAKPGSARWKQAQLDADLSFPAAAGTFSCALKAPISEAQTPRLYKLLQRTMVDAGLATYRAKNRYNRTRPFVFTNTSSCTPDDEAKLAKDGSYPSGHSAAGWAWALVLTEIVPDRTDAILARGRAFGQSRIACNVHWQSDVNEGRMVAAATVARLHGDPVFEADLAAARDELAKVRAQGLPPTRDCAAEAAALATNP
ncbi:MAG: phosphatase PAP2 family protein [Cupriavidus sp.]|nr:phosphatase PAP2 family protein [Cupriavidus sp.]